MYAWTAAVSFGLVAIALTHQLMVAGFVLVAVVLLVFVTRRRVRLRLPEAHG
jgi:Flp pilus assembly protein TadB